MTDPTESARTKALAYLAEVERQRAEAVRAEAERDSPGLACEHGALARACEVGELQSTIRALEAKAEAWEREALRYAQNADFWRADRDRLAGEVERLTKYASRLEFASDSLAGEIRTRGVELAAAREDALSAAIERAAGELPEGHQISVHVERNAGWVEATVTIDDGVDMSLAEQVNALIDAARRAGG